MALSVNRYGSLLATYLRPQGMRVLLLIVLLLGNIGLQLANPQILALFIDTATMRGALQTLVYIALAFLVVAILGQMVAVTETYVAENVGLTATNKLRADLTLTQGQYPAWPAGGGGKPASRPACRRVGARYC